MTFKELKKKSVSELHQFLADSRNQLRELRFKDANQQLKTVRQIRQLRKEVAQALTLLNAGKTEVKPVVETEAKEVVAETTETVETKVDNQENK